MIGIGVNVHQRQFPSELADVATSLALAGHDVDRLALLARISAELDRLERPEERGKAIAEWRSRSTFIGNAVGVSTQGRSFDGVADAIDDDGALVVRTKGGVERVVSGDVVVKRR